MSRSKNKPMPSLKTDAQAVAGKTAG